MADQLPLSWMLDAVHPGDVVMDIGANRGYYSLGILSNNPQARIFAFEPNPDIYKKLKANLDLNAQLGHIDAFPLALGEREENVTLHISAEDSASSLNAEHAIFFGRKIVSVVEIQLTTLDILLTRGTIPVPNHIKIDTEGFEGPILRGAYETLRTHRPHLYIEIHKRVPAGDNEAEIRSVLDPLAYRIVKEDHFLLCQ